MESIPNRVWLRHFEQCSPRQYIIFYHGKLQSRTQVVGTLEPGHISPIPLINVGKYRVSSNKKRKNHPITNIVSGGGESLLAVPTFLSGIVDQ